MLYEVITDAVVKNTTHEGPLHSVGRLGCDYYNKLGYVPYNVGINENVARTLEYAFADYCIYELGKELGKPKKEIAIFAKRAMNRNNFV